MEKILPLKLSCPRPSVGGTASGSRLNQEFVLFSNFGQSVATQPCTDSCETAPLRYHWSKLEAEAAPGQGGCVMGEERWLLESKVTEVGHGVLQSRVLTPVLEPSTLQAKSTSSASLDLLSSCYRCEFAFDKIL